MIFFFVVNRYECKKRASIFSAADGFSACVLRQLVHGDSRGDFQVYITAPSYIRSGIYICVAKRYTSFAEYICSTDCFVMYLRVLRNDIFSLFSLECALQNYS